LKDQSVVGIGETGIDLYHDKTYYAEQLIAFETQLNWAKDLQMPLSIHIRDGLKI